jgi:hypothetical protein
MTKRPLSVIIAGCVLSVAGVTGLLYHLTEIDAQRPFEMELIWVLLLRALAIVCGVFILYRKNWARWLAMLWLLYHVVLSGFHAFPEFAMHSLLLALFAYLLFRPPASEYFIGRRADGL